MPPVPCLAGTTPLIGRACPGSPAAAALRPAGKPIHRFCPRLQIRPEGSVRRSVLGTEPRSLRRPSVPETFSLSELTAGADPLTPAPARPPGLARSLTEAVLPATGARIRSRRLAPRSRRWWRGSSLDVTEMGRAPSFSARASRATSWLDRTGHPAASRSALGLASRCLGCPASSASPGPGRRVRDASAGAKCQTPALSSNRHRRRLDIRANLGSNRWTNAGRVR